MPTHVIVILAIAAVIAFLLLMRVKVCIAYSGEFDIAVKYLFFTLRMKKKEKGQTKQEKKVTHKFTYEQFRQFLDLFKRFWGDAKAALLKIKKKARIDYIIIDLTVAGDDAAKTAITYGEVCAAIFPVISALEMLVKVKKRQITINADFNGTAAKLNFDCRASMRLGGLLATGIASAVKILISLIKNPINISQRGVAK